jgi:C4-dicarboxylate-specific signal transduction histidine kinase
MNPSLQAVLGLRSLAGRGATSAGVALLACLFLVMAIAGGAYLAEYEIRLSVLYLGPIALTTWILGRRAGILITILSTISWSITYWSSHPNSQPFYFFCEGSMTFAMFLVTVALLTRLHEALESSNTRLLTVLEGLEAAVHVEDARTGASLYDNRRFLDQFGASRRFSQDSGEIHVPERGAWFRLQSRKLQWTDGRNAVLRMLTDVTEERAAREAAAKQSEAAHRTARMVALGEFASGIAHELNQPLAAISTYNEASLRLLGSGASSVEQLREAMQKCRDQSRRAGAIIQRLRELLRNPVRSPAPLDLREVAITVRQLAEREATEAGVTIELDVQDFLPSVRSDELLVEQVALNLVRNAIEAVRELPHERRRVTVSIRTDDRGDVVFSVSDLGNGVSPDVNDRLFEPFVTTKPGGLGLGLSICRSVIESLGGSIRYELGTGPGTRFCFMLPAGNR